MMNAQDAQGFMEDVAVIEAGRRAANDVAENGHAVAVAQHHTDKPLVLPVLPVSPVVELGF